MEVDGCEILQFVLGTMKHCKLLDFATIHSIVDGGCLEHVSKLADVASLIWYTEDHQ